MKCIINDSLLCTPGAHFIEVVINDNLSFTEYYHGNSASKPIKSRMSLYLSVNDKLSLMTSSMKWAPGEPLVF